jgi:hypothetical protein
MDAEISKYGLTSETESPVLNESVSMAWLIQEHFAWTSRFVYNPAANFILLAAQDAFLSHCEPSLCPIALFSRWKKPAPQSVLLTEIGWQLDAS